MSTTTTKPETAVRHWRDFLPPIFAACVADEDGRYKLTAPFIAGNYVAATNGAILVRGPKSLADDAIVAGVLSLVTEGIPPVNEPSLGWDAEYATDPLPIEQIPPIEPATECPDCYRGEVRCEYDHLHECPRCGGFGSLVCNRRFDFGSIVLQEKYVRPLLNAGAKVYVQKKSPATRPAMFKIDGGIDGLLLPFMRSDMDDLVKVGGAQ